MIINMNWMTATDINGATSLASEAVAHLNETYESRTAAGVSLTGPAGRLGFISLTDSIDQVLANREAMAADPKIAELLASSESVIAPGSGVNYMFRIVHGTPTMDPDRKLLFLRGTISKGIMSSDQVSAAVQIAEHIESVHGTKCTLATSIGGDGTGTLFAVGFNSGAQLEQFAEASASDDLLQKLVGKIQDSTAEVRDRLISLIR